MQIYSLLFNFQKKYGVNLFFSLRFCVFLSCLCLIRPFHAPHFSISVAMLYSRYSTVPLRVSQCCTLGTKTLRNFGTAGRRLPLPHIGPISPICPIRLVSPHRPPLIILYNVSRPPIPLILSNKAKTTCFIAFFFKNIWSVTKNSLPLHPLLRTNAVTKRLRSSLKGRKRKSSLKRLQ